MSHKDCQKVKDLDINLNLMSTLQQEDKEAEVELKALMENMSQTKQSSLLKEVKNERTKTIEVNKVLNIMSDISYI